MFNDWSHLFDAAIKTLPPLHQEIVVRTMQVPGKRTRIFYKEALNFWGLDRVEFDRQRAGAIESVRIYLAQHGLSSPEDLAVL